MYVNVSMVFFSYLKGKMVAESSVGERDASREQTKERRKKLEWRACRMYMPFHISFSSSAKLMRFNTWICYCCCLREVSGHLFFFLKEERGGVGVRLCLGDGETGCATGSSQPYTWRGDDAGVTAISSVLDRCMISFLLSLCRDRFFSFFLVWDGIQCWCLQERVGTRMDLGGGRREDLSLSLFHTSPSPFYLLFFWKRGGSRIWMIRYRDWSTSSAMGIAYVLNNVSFFSLSPFFASCLRRQLQ